MEDQFTHKDEKGDGEQSESRNGSENSCHYRNKAWYPPQEEIGRNHIDNEKGKRNGQVGEEQEHHTPKEQADDQPPFHGLPSCLDRPLENAHLLRYPAASLSRRRGKKSLLIRRDATPHRSPLRRTGNVRLTLQDFGGLAFGHF
jgi:hypothetical protein